MEKTKLGVSVGLVGAFVCALAGFGGYVAAAIAVGYVLLFEQNEWLKKTAVKAAATLVVYGFLIVAIGLIPDIITWVLSIFDVLGAEIHLDFITGIFRVITRCIEIFRDLLFVGLTYKAINQGTINVPIVDGLVNKYM